MTGGTAVTLRFGLPGQAADVSARSVNVRPLTGADEARLAELGPGVSSAAWATAVLAGTVRCGAASEAIGPEAARGLTIGDRERLLLSLYAATFGEPLEAVVPCRTADCGSLLEFAFDVADVLSAPQPSEDDTPFELTVRAGGRRLRVRCRLPTGGDQEIVAALATREAADAADRLLRRCICAVADSGGAAAEPDAALLAALRGPLEQAIADLDPDAELRLYGVCPSCGAEVRALLDAGRFLADEIWRSGAIFAEVDRLARAYHWSEAEILALPVSRRRRYLGLAVAAS